MAVVKQHLKSFSFNPQNNTYMTVFFYQLKCTYNSNNEIAFIIKISAIWGPIQSLHLSSHPILFNCILTSIFTWSFQHLLVFLQSWIQTWSTIASSFLKVLGKLGVLLSILCVKSYTVVVSLLLLVQIFSLKFFLSDNNNRLFQEIKIFFKGTNFWFLFPISRPGK